MRILLFILITLLSISCERNDNNKNKSAEQINIQNETKIEIERTEQNNYEFTDITNADRNSRKIMFVSNIQGLQERLSPSIDGKITGRFLYCEIIAVYDKSEEPVTIDGITDYWYKMAESTGYYSEETEYGRFSFVFGGHISETLPSDATITELNGSWLGTAENETISYVFFGNFYNFRPIYGWVENKGTFSITNDTIVFNQIRTIIHRHGEKANINELNIISTHTYNLNNNILKISKHPLESNEYNALDNYSFEKSLDTNY